MLLFAPSSKKNHHHVTIIRALSPSSASAMPRLRDDALAGWWMAYAILGSSLLAWWWWWWWYRVHHASADGPSEDNNDDATVPREDSVETTNDNISRTTSSFPWEPQGEVVRVDRVETKPPLPHHHSTMTNDPEAFLATMTFANNTGLRSPSCPCCQ